MASSGTQSSVGTSSGRNRAAWIIGLVVATLAVSFVLLSLRQPELPTFPPSSMSPTPAGTRLVGPRTYTIDARASDVWLYFSFSQGSLITEPAPLEWDVAFRRFQVLVNGGEAFPGEGGVINLGAVDFDSLTVLPERGYQGTEVFRGDSISAPIEGWYNYSFFTHLLSPRSTVYAIRTADGRYAKLRFLGYYCPGARPGCVTFEYVFQGAGGPRLADPT